MQTRTVLEAIRVHGSGFLFDSQIAFAANLNCIIGARGTGKTSLLELIRFAVGREDDSARIQKSLADLIPAALGEGGYLELDLTTPLDQRLTVRRDVSSEFRTFDRDSGQDIDIEWPPLGLYDIAIFSQNQLEDIATDPAERLKMLDTFCGQELERFVAEIQSVELKLEANAAQQIQLSNEIEALQLQSDTLPKLEADLATIEAQYSAALQEMKGHEADKERVAKLASEKNLLARQDQLLSAALTDAENALLESFPGRQLGERLRASLSTEAIVDLPGFEVLRQLRDDVAQHAQKFASLRDQMTDELTQIRDLIGSERTSTQAILHAIGTEHQKYSAILGAVSKAWKDVSARREALLAQIRTLRTAQEGIKERITRRLLLEDDRKKLLNRFEELRHGRYVARLSAASTLTDATGGSVRIAVFESAQLDTYEQFLLQSLKGSGLWYARIASALVQRVPPGRLAELVRGGEASTIAQLADIDPERSRKVVNFLSESQLTYRLEAIDVGDSVRFELRLNGGQYQETERLSQGQRCTTVLSILLVDSTSPLVIDQPEDNLDNSYVVDSVVEVILRQKETRQFIFVTHNPNIAVLGEAERVIAMSAREGHGGAEVQGPWYAKPVKREILRVMEGGEDAFSRRRRAYEAKDDQTNELAI
jgi:ABC-type lipoprotein export system ATPase subunit